MADQPVVLTREWQPIATAPRDGTRILLGKYVKDIAAKIDRWYWIASGYFDVDGAWCDFTDDGFNADNRYYHGPTHWMPLPEPPK